MRNNCIARTGHRCFQYQIILWVAQMGSPEEKNLLEYSLLAKVVQKRPDIHRTDFGRPGPCQDLLIFEDKWDRKDELKSPAADLGDHSKRSAAPAPERGHQNVCVQDDTRTRHMVLSVIPVLDASATMAQCDGGAATRRLIGDSHRWLASPLRTRLLKSADLPRGTLSDTQSPLRACFASATIWPT